jgi:hypothetical protein
LIKITTEISILKKTIGLENLDRQRDKIKNLRSGRRSNEKLQDLSRRKIIPTSPHHKSPRTTGFLQEKLY